MRHNKTWNGFLPVVGVVTLVGLSGCAKEKLEVVESGFSCSGEINSNVWNCTGTARMERDDLEQTFVVIDDPVPAQVTVSGDTPPNEALESEEAQASTEEPMVAAEDASINEPVDVAEHTPVDDQFSGESQASIEEPEAVAEVETMPPEPEWVQAIPAELVATPDIDQSSVTPVSQEQTTPAEPIALTSPEAMAAPAANNQLVSADCSQNYSADKFYLQFSASRQADGLKVLAARLQPVETEIIQTIVKGELWQVLVSKGFSTREAAGSLATLLKQQGVNKPWVRPGYSLLPVMADPSLTLPDASGCP